MTTFFVPFWSKVAMRAERMLLETDPQGRLKTLPITLPPNRRVEAIFLVLDEPFSPPAKCRPAPSIAGKGKTPGDLIAPIVPEEDWDCLK